MKIFDINLKDIIMLNPMDDYDVHQRQLLGIYTKSIRYFVYVNDELLNAIFTAYEKKELTLKQKTLLEAISTAQDVNTMIASFEYCYYIDGTTKYMVQDGMK